MVSRPAFLLCLLACVVAYRSPALDSTALSGRTLAPGTTGVGATVGFPYVTASVQQGLGPAVDLALVVRSGWGQVQRAGVAARFRLADGVADVLTLRTAVSSRLGGARAGLWPALTGEHDLTLAFDLLASWATSRGAVLTVSAGVQLVGAFSPPLDPLPGERPWVSVGPNLTTRAIVELPLSQALVGSLELGLDAHLSGFDDGTLMPAFAAGLGWLL